jgi:hypothetical protein
MDCRSLLHRELQIVLFSLSAWIHLMVNLDRVRDVCFEKRRLNAYLMHLRWQSCESSFQEQ